MVTSFSQTWSTELLAALANTGERAKISFLLVNYRFELAEFAVRLAT
jgi:hypothetical protein